MKSYETYTKALQDLNNLFTGEIIETRTDGDYMLWRVSIDTIEPYFSKT